MGYGDRASLAPSGSVGVDWAPKPMRMWGGRAWIGVGNGGGPGVREFSGGGA